MVAARRLAITVALFITAAPEHALAERSIDPTPHPTALWFAAQLLPASELASGAGEASFGLRWTVTPLLWSFGVNRRRSPWRWFVAEPNVRHSGSIELFVSPEALFGRRVIALVRPGVRLYFPLLERGDALSASVAASLQSIDGVHAPSIEVAMYALYGICALSVSYAPGPVTPAQTIISLSLRYF
ncbi:MAG: hypothetical protein JNK05_09305 [Myxococcales bacterium]|nr:hypothetical protein [Myxococcales bacterium]